MEDEKPNKRQIISRPFFEASQPSLYEFKGSPFFISGRMLPYLRRLQKRNIKTVTELDEFIEKVNLPSTLVRTLTEELEDKHEQRMYKEYGNAVTLIKFPEETHPFWNMKINDDGTYNKADVIMGGMETIGSAEREIHTVKMMSRFKALSDGKYAGKLHSLFGIPRVQKEMDKYLSFDFFPRFGGGIGLTRLARAFALLEESGS